MPYIDPITGEPVFDPTLDGGYEDPLLAQFGGMGGDLAQPPVYPEPQPAPEPPVPGYAPPPPAGPESGKVSAAHTGFSAPRFAEVQRVMTPEMEGERARIAGRVDAASGAMGDAVGLAGDSSRLAAESSARANAGLEEAGAAGAAQMGALSERFAAAEQDAAVQSRLQVEKVRSSYNEQIQRVAAMRVDPDRLFKEAGAFGRVGFALMAFAQGFLGAKGIKVTAIETMRDRINDDINAQLTDIEQGRETTQQFRSLYEMAKQDSADDAQMRERLRGFYWESAKQYIVADVGKYKSQLALAQGDQAIASINAEQAESMGKISQWAVEAYQKGVADYQQYALGQARIAVDKDQIALQRENNALAAKAAQASAVFTTEIVDPSTGESLGRSRDAARATILQKRMNASATASDQAAQLIAHMEKIGGINTASAMLSAVAKKLGADPNAALTADEALLVGMRNDLAAVLALARNPDGRISDSDIDIANDRLQVDSTIKRATTKKSLAQAFYGQLQGVRDDVRGGTVALNADELPFSRSGNLSGADRALKARATELKDIVEGRDKPEETSNYKAGKAINADTGAGPVDDSDGSTLEMAQAAQDVKAFRDAGNDLTLPPSGGSTGEAVEYSVRGVPTFAVGARALVNAAKAGDKNALESLELRSADPDLDPVVYQYIHWLASRNGLKMRVRLPEGYVGSQVGVPLAP